MKKLSDLFCKMTDIRFFDLRRKGGVFFIPFANLKTREVRVVFISFTLEDLWILPRYEKHFSKVDFPCAGWLFFRFGLYNEGILYPGPFGKIKGNNNKNYHIYPFKDRAEADECHKKIKADKANFFIVTHDCDGISHLTDFRTI